MKKRKPAKGRMRVLKQNSDPDLRVFNKRKKAKKITNDGLDVEIFISQKGRKKK